jgi:hypothetical protein
MDWIALVLLMGLGLAMAWFPCCCGNGCAECEYCVDGDGNHTRPKCFKIVITGVTAGIYGSDPENVNGTYFVDCDGAIGGCDWNATASPRPERCSSIGCTAGGLFCPGVNIGPGAGCPLGSVCVGVSLWPFWSHDTVVSVPFDCNTYSLDFDLNPYYAYDLNYCYDWTACHVHIEACEPCV